MNEGQIQPKWRLQTGGPANDYNLTANEIWKEYAQLREHGGIPQVVASQNKELHLLVTTSPQISSVERGISLKVTPESHVIEQKECAQEEIRSSDPVKTD